MGDRQVGRYLTTEGWSLASFCWIASALRYSTSASPGLCASDNKLPRLLWVIASSLCTALSAR